MAAPINAWLVVENQGSWILTIVKIFRISKYMQSRSTNNRICIEDSWTDPRVS